MAKILITSVGTGDIKKDSDSDYIETRYRLEGREYLNTLTSQVIAEHYGIDKIFFVGTSGSMWDNLYLKYGGEDEDYLDLLSQKKLDGSLKQEDLHPFLEQIDRYLGSQGSRAILIGYDGEDKSEEIWDNFERLLSIREAIDEDDILYLDITHGFRYMPMLNLFMLETLRSLGERDLNVCAILYGIFAGNQSEIVDFKIFFDLMDWIKAINDFKRHGDGWSLAALIRDEEPKASNVLVQFSDQLHLANIHALWGFVKDIRRKLTRLEKSENKIIHLLSAELATLARRLDKERQSDFQFELAKWLFEQRNYAMSYIALYEAIITKSCELNGTLNCADHHDREKAKRSIGDDRFGRHFYTKYSDSISRIRNAIVHQNTDRKARTTDDIHRLEKFLRYFEDYFSLGASSASPSASSD